MSAAASPFVGFAIDKIGKRPHIAIIAGIFLTIGNALVAIGGGHCEPKDCPNRDFVFGPLVLIGLGYCIYGAAIWASIPYVVPPHTLGTAFGVTTAIQNGGMAVFPTIGAYIHDQTKDMKDGLKGFRYVSFSFYSIQQAIWWSALSLVGLLTSVWLLIVDMRNNGGILSKSASAKEANENLEQMMTSPQVGEDRAGLGAEYGADANKRQALKRTLGSSMAKAH